MTASERSAPASSRATHFALLARRAIEKHFAEARTTGAYWTSAPNEACVRVALEDGRSFYLALRRHLDWVSGEVGVSREPMHLRELEPEPGPASGAVPGLRIRAGDLLHGDDRWWPAGHDDKALVGTLESLALQLAIKGVAHYRRTLSSGS